MKPSNPLAVSERFKQVVARGNLRYEAELAKVKEIPVQMLPFKEGWKVCKIRRPKKLFHDEEEEKDIFDDLPGREDLDALGISVKENT